jgi:hypothetical protein
MLVTFDALAVSKALAKFSEDELEKMAVVVDSATKRMTVEVVGVRAAIAFLEKNGYVMGKDFTLEQAIDCASSLMIELDARESKRLPAGRPTGRRPRKPV